MKQLILAAGLFFALTQHPFAQTTQASGNWSDPTIWSGGAVPASGGTVTVANPVTIDANLSPSGGSITFNNNATDQPGRTAYTFNPSGGTVTINSGSVVTFEGGSSATPNNFSGGTIDIYGTLILGYTSLANSSSLNITVESGGTLIINGNLTDKNNQGTFTINGAVIVNGNFANSTGHVTVGGTGTINTTGSLTNTGGSTIFGSNNNCNTGPCSGGTLVCSFTNSISPASQAVCSGTSGIKLTSSATGTFKWLSSTDGVNFTTASGTSTASSYTTPALTQTTWYEVTVTSGGCTSTSAPVEMTVLSGGGWQGGTSNDWGTASNWCSLTVPTSTTDVTITNATGIKNMPTINNGTAASVHNLTISNTSPASSVTIAASTTASLSVYGDLTVNGNLTDNSTASTAGVIMAGSVAQNINGSTAPVFRNLTINNTSGIVPAVIIPSNNVAVNLNLTLTSGIVNLDGNNLTLGVSGTNIDSAGILNFTTGSYIFGGNIERWFTTGPLTLGAAASLFPVGTATDYRPMYFGTTTPTGITAAGTIKVSHSGLTGYTPVSFTDAGSTIQVRTNAYWTVNTANGITGTGVTVRTEATGFGSIGNVSDLRLTLSASAASGTAGTNGTTSSGAPQVNRTTFTNTNLANTYYWGSTSSSFSTLPVNLVSFTATPQTPDIVLNWKTATEADCSYFSLERSADGVNYAAIATVPTEGGPDQGHQYAYTDYTPNPGENYYRLKMVSYSGAANYSAIATASIAEAGRLTLFPNPSDGSSITASITNPAGAGLTSLSPTVYTVDVYNDQGMLVRHTSSPTPTFNIQFTPSLTPGIYVARVSSSSGFTAVASFLVRR